MCKKFFKIGNIECQSRASNICSLLSLPITEVEECLFEIWQVVHCESWPACFTMMCFFFFYYPPRQLKLNIDYKRNPMETNWTFTSKNFRAHHHFFYADHNRSFSRVRAHLFAPKLSFIGEIALLYDAAWRHGITMLFIRGRQKLWQPKKKKKWGTPNPQSEPLTRILLRLSNFGFTRCSRKEKRSLTLFFEESAPHFSFSSLSYEKKIERSYKF